MHSVHKLLSGLIIKSCAVWSAYQTRSRAFGCVSSGAPRPHASHAQALLKPFYTFRRLFLFFCHCCSSFVCLLEEHKERGESKSARVWVRASLDNDAAITGSFIQPPASSISLSGIPLPVCHPCSATPTSHIQSQGINESGVQLCRKSKRATGDAPEEAGTKTHWIEWRKSAYVRT